MDKNEIRAVMRGRGPTLMVVRQPENDGKQTPMRNAPKNRRFVGKVGAADREATRKRPRM